MNAAVVHAKMEELAMMQLTSILAVVRQAILEPIVRQVNNSSVLLNFGFIC